MTSPNPREQTATPVLVGPARRGARVAFFVGGLIPGLAVLGQIYGAISGDIGTMGMLDYLLGMNMAGSGAAPSRLFDVFTYFTNISGTLVALVSLMLAFGHRAYGRLFRVLRLDSIVMIVVVEVVVIIGLLTHNPGVAFNWSTQVIHFVVPPLTVAIWLLYGPRGLIDRKVVGWSLVIPLAYLVFALIRGEVIMAFPYTFLAFSVVGPLATILAVVTIGGIFVAVGLAYRTVDRWLAVRSRLSQGVGTGSGHP